MDQDPVRELLRTLPGVVYRCTHDPHWTMQLLSDEIEVVTGFTAASFMANRDRSFASVIHPDDRERVAREVDAQLAEQDDFACEYRIVHADGTILWILERGRRVHGPHGRTDLLDGLMFDITDRKRAQEQLRASMAEQAAHRAVVEERAHVVRELHDSVGHALSVLSLYGGITATHLTADPEAAQATVKTMRDVVKDTRSDMDRLLGAIGRIPDGPAASDLTDVPVLVDRVRAAGVPVELTITGETEPHTSELGHTAYRVVQEALTNAMKHAPQATVTVQIHHSKNNITIEVANGAGAEPPTPDTGPRKPRRVARGLTGLGDRVRKLDGQLTLGTRPQGGFGVTAVLPYRAQGTTGAHTDPDEEFPATTPA